MLPSVPVLDDLRPIIMTLSLCSVAKDPNTHAISIISHVFKTHAKVKGQRVFPGSCDHEQSFCYLIIDNVKRHVTAWYNVWY